jgi:hypothetical protein
MGPGEEASGIGQTICTGDPGVGGLSRRASLRLMRLGNEYLAPVCPADRPINNPQILNWTMSSPPAGIIVDAAAPLSPPSLFLPLRACTAHSSLVSGGTTEKFLDARLFVKSRALAFLSSCKSRRRLEL